jgi:hypothetical protein
MTARSRTGSRTPDLSCNPKTAASARIRVGTQYCTNTARKLRLGRSDCRAALAGWGLWGSVRSRGYKPNRGTIIR